MISRRKAKKAEQKKRAQTWGTPEFFAAIDKHDKKADPKRKRKGLKYTKKKK